MAVSSGIFYDINDMRYERDEEGVPQPELRVLENANAAMLKGLEEWKKLSLIHI